MGDLGTRKRLRDESEEAESDIDSPEVKRLRENLVDSSDDDPEFCTTGLDLESFMKSFEKEITASPSAGGDELAVVEVVDLTSDSGESRPDLGFLLEASDDDLGLPPTMAVDSSEFGADLWGLETEIPDYELRGFGLIQTEVFDGVNCEYVTIDGLFDYPDLGFWSGDFIWRHDTLPAQQDTSGRGYC